nr:hypothetical protein [Amycolatopsis xylanica]
MFLIPIVAGAAAYGWLSRDKSGSYAAGDGDRKIDCYQIWYQLNHGPGPQSISDGQSSAATLKSVYQQRLTTIDKLARDMDAAWQGGGVQAAQAAGAHPLKAWMLDSGRKLTESDKYLGEQHEAFNTVISKVVQVPEKPPENNFLNSITPWETDTDRAIKDYNKNGQANVDAFNEYFKASNANGEKMPTYSQMSGDVDKVGVTGDGKDGNGKDKDKPGGDDGKGVDDGGKGRGSIPGGGSVPGGGSIPGGGSMPGGPGSIPGYKPGQIPGAPGGYKPPNIPGYQPGQVPGGPGSYTPPKYPGWNDDTRAAGYQPGSIPGFGPGSGSGSIPGGGSGFTPGGGGSIDTGGFGPGSGGAIGTGGFGPGSGTGAALPGQGLGPGAGAGGAGAAGAAGAAAAAGKGGMMGGGMGGMGHGAKGGGAEDTERSSKFLLGEDGNELFGTDELTAPPVIGE